MRRQRGRDPTTGRPERTVTFLVFCATDAGRRSLPVALCAEAAREHTRSSRNVAPSRHALCHPFNPSPSPPPSSSQDSPNYFFATPLVGALASEDATLSSPLAASLPPGVVPALGAGPGALPLGATSIDGESDGWIIVESNYKVRGTPRRPGRGGGARAGERRCPRRHASRPR